MQRFRYKTATGNEKDKPRLQKDILSVIFDHSEPQVLVYSTASAMHPGLLDEQSHIPAEGQQQRAIMNTRQQDTNKQNAGTRQISLPVMLQMLPLCTN